MISLDYLVNPANYESLCAAMEARKGLEMFKNFLAQYKKVAETMTLPPTEELEERARYMTLREVNNPQDEIGKMLALYLSLPNVSHKIVPLGNSSEQNIILKESAPKTYQTKKNYEQIGADFGIFSKAMNETIAEMGFPVLSGVGPKLERALIGLMLDHHADYGYDEISMPILTHERTFFMAGSFPKHQHNVYKIEGTSLYLNPTIEMQETSLIRNRKFEYDELPMKVVGFARSFRVERGREIDLYTNLHEFGKVESFTVCREDQWEEVLNSLSAMLENLLEKLGFMWRKLLLCTGDMGQAGSFTCDYEIYAPGLKKWLEISSLSYRATFQACSLNATYLTPEGEKKYVHTYNTPGFAIPRVFAALLECMYQEDGTLKIPDCLVGRCGLPAVVKKDTYFSQLIKNKG